MFNPFQQAPTNPLLAAAQGATQGKDPLADRLGVSGKLPTDWTQPGGGTAALSPDAATGFDYFNADANYPLFQNYVHGNFFKQGKNLPGTNISNLGQLNQALFGSPYDSDIKPFTEEKFNEIVKPWVQDAARDWEIRDISRSNQQDGGLFSPKNLFSAVAVPLTGGVAGPIAGAALGGLSGAQDGPLGVLTGAASGYLSGIGGGGNSFDTFNSYFSPDRFQYTLQNLPGLAGSGPAHGGVVGSLGTGTLGSYSGNVAGNALNNALPGLFPAGTPSLGAGTGSLGLGVSPPLAGNPFVLPPSIGGNPGGGIQLPDNTGYQVPTGGGTQDPLPPSGGDPYGTGIDLGQLPIPQIPGGATDTPQPPQDPTNIPLPIPIPTGGGGNSPDLPDLPQVASAPSNYNVSSTSGWDSRFQERGQARLPEVPLYFSQLQTNEPQELEERQGDMFWDPFAYQQYLVNPYV